MSDQTKQPAADAATDGKAAVLLFKCNASDAGREIATRVLVPAACTVRASSPEHLQDFYRQVHSALLGCMVADYGSEFVKEILHAIADAIPNVGPHGGGAAQPH